MVRSWFGLLLVIGLAACDAVGPPAPPIPVAKLLFLPDTGTMVAGDALQLNVFLQDSAGAPLTGRVVFWSSLDPTIASITGTGLARGINPGTARIVARADSAADTATVTVIPIVFTQVSTGATHSCGRRNNGTVACWGFNFYGQAGVGNFGFIVDGPVTVAGGLLYTTIAIGGDHSCAIGTDALTYCWGRNTSSELGRGLLPGDMSVPAPVATNVHFVLVRAGGAHTCALTADSLAFCWGADDDGQLGDSQPATMHATPVLIPGRRFGSLSAGAAHTCGLAVGGTAYCWGRDSTGQVGDSATGVARFAPVPVRGGLTFVALAAGADHTCGLATDSTAYCWGANTRGAIGTGAPGAPEVVPAAVSGGRRFLAVAAGGGFSCGIAADSTAYCWGANDHGQLGDSTATDQDAPVAVYGGRKFSALQAGVAHACGLATTGTLYCWGQGTTGELGTGLRNDSPIPVPVAGQ